MRSTLQPTDTLDAAVMDSLATAFRGVRIGPDDARYDEARRVYNSAIDRRPALIVRPVDTADIVAAIHFGREHALPIAVRGGGHHGAGFGSVDDGLVIDLSSMRSVRVDPANRTVRVEPGATLADLDHATHAFGLAVPTGVLGSTGIAGLALGGGVGYLSRAYGLTIDNLLEADVVLASGDVVTASSDREPDLFWGLRGGGGNFGIVSSFVFRAHPVSTVVGGPMLYDLHDAQRVLRWYRTFMLKAREDLSGFVAFLTVPPAPIFPAGLHLRKMMAIVWCYAGPIDDADAAFAPIRAAAPPTLDGVQPLPFPALQGASDALYPAGLRWQWRAHYISDIPDDAIEQNVRFARALPTLHSTSHIYPVDGAVHRVGASDTAFSHREARWVQVIVGVDPYAANDDAIREWTRGYWQAIRPYALGGAYVNMFTEDERDPVRRAYRDNYDRLSRIKGTYDPDNVFRLNQNILPS